MNLMELYHKFGYAKYPTDKGSGHSYLEVYDRLFLPFQHLEIGVFECGSSAGGGLKLFEDYFTKAKILGIDNRGDDDIIAWGTKFSTGRVEVRKADLRQLTADFFNDFPVHIAIDDSSHALEDQLLFSALMYPIIQPGGLIIIEDVDYPEERRKSFESLGIPFELIDLNQIQYTRDNALIIIRKDG